MTRLGALDPTLSRQGLAELQAQMAPTTKPEPRGSAWHGAREGRRTHVFFKLISCTRLLPRVRRLRLSPGVEGVSGGDGAAVQLGDRPRQAAASGQTAGCEGFPGRCVPGVFIPVHGCCPPRGALVGQNGSLTQTVSSWPPEPPRPFQPHRPSVRLPVRTRLASPRELERLGCQTRAPKRTGLYAHTREAFPRACSKTRLIRDASRYV